VPALHASEASTHLEDYRSLRASVAMCALIVARAVRREPPGSRRSDLLRSVVDELLSDADVIERLAAAAGPDAGAGPVP
jgi:hypothetical protein